MKKTIGILLIVLTFGCANRNLNQKRIYIQDENLFGELKNGIPEKDTLIEIKNGKLLSVGKVAVSKNGTSVMKFGNWKNYNENGILKSKGEYKIGKYVDCGVGGIEQMFYHYKTGIWEFYNNKGETELKLEFIPKEHFIDTRCDGGDKMLFGIIEKVPSEYYGKVNSDLIYELQKVEYNESYQNTIAIPLNGKAYITRKDN
ncbi:hypothetical protein BA195_13625 [Tenacibaculum soleae]|uniref:Uncharacterized protein n=1 Tax=Tenacibaculum soleae TaxID=447689 RepID=A0A1B9XWF0_9FLAO|nr:hypothetical protein [Tenacibaculum soleae]OCK41826.1 hypothetical protein BA195_13625 [Tenacibaculum soleae]